jgi:hypothetical protein
MTIGLKMIFLLPLLVCLSGTANAGHLFTQSNQNTPINLTAGTGLQITQNANGFEAETPSLAANGQLSLYFYQTAGADATKNWVAGDAIKITIGSYTDTFYYSHPLAGLITQNSTELLVNDPLLAQAAINTATHLHFTVIDVAGQFTFEGYRIYTTTGTYHGTGAAPINQSQVVSASSLSGGGSPTASDTQTALAYNVAAIHGISAIQTGTINNSMNYDCTLFDKAGLCLSTGGRYSNASVSHANTTDAMIIGAYKLDDNIRIGAYVDQNLYNTTVGSIASFRSNTPLLGMFGVWNENQDRSGFEVKLSAGYNNSNLYMSRIAVGTSELGIGATGVNTVAGAAVVSYGIKLTPEWLTAPYFGVRHTSLTMQGYTETSPSLVNPLTYNTLHQDSTTALVGIRMSGHVLEDTSLFGSAGFEQDMYNYFSNYVATGLAGLTPIALNSNIQQTRAVMTFGVNYDLERGQRIGLTTIWRQEAYLPVDTKTAYITYTMGF